MRPSLRQLQVFCTIVDEASFRRCAEIMNTSQPGLSRSIRVLEETIGAQLLIRTTRSVRVTAAGEEFYRRAKLILRDFRDTIIATKEVANGHAGNLNISYLDFALIGPLPGILSSFRNSRPNVQLIVRYMPTNDQIPMLVQGKMDIGFVFGQPAIDGFTTRPLVTEGLVAILPSEHKLASRKRIKLSELAGENFVLGDARWHRFNDKFFDFCHSCGFSPKVNQTAYTRDELIGFVLAGNGISVYPECIQRTPRPGITYVPLGEVPTEIVTSAMWRTDSDNPLLNAFIEHL